MWALVLLLVHLLIDHGSSTDEDCGDAMTCALQGFDTDSELDGEDPLRQRWMATQINCAEDEACKGYITNHANVMGQVADGFTGAQELFTGFNDVIRKTSPFKNVAGILAKIGPFLGAGGALIGILAGFENSDESKLIIELTNIVNDGFSRVHTRFNRLDSQINALYSRVVAEGFKTRVTLSLDSLSQVQLNVNRYLIETEYDDQITKRKMLTRALYTKGQGAINNLKNYFIKNDFVEVCSDLQSATGANRNLVMASSIHVFLRILQGMQNMITIGKSLNKDATTKGTTREIDIDDTLVEMEGWITDIYRKINYCDEQLERESWKSQWKLDLNKAIEDYNAPGMESQVADHINKTLSDKYYWRDFSIVVSRHLPADSNGVDLAHTVACESAPEKSIANLIGKINGKYDIMVANIKRESSITYCELNTGTKSYRWVRPNALSNYQSTMQKLGCKNIYEQQSQSMRNNCGCYIKGAIRQEANPQIRTPAGRMHRLRLGMYNKVAVTVFALG